MRKHSSSISVTKKLIRKYFFRTTKMRSSKKSSSNLEQFAAQFCSYFNSFFINNYFLQQKKTRKHFLNKANAKFDATFSFVRSFTNPQNYFQGRLFKSESQEKDVIVIIPFGQSVAKAWLTYKSVLTPEVRSSSPVISRY